MTDSHRSHSGLSALEAAEWHMRLAAPAATEADWLAFEQWLSVPDNKAAYEALERALEEVEHNPRAVAAVADGAPPVRSIVRRSILWVAPALAMATAAALAIYLRPATPPPVAYEAQANADRTIVLADDTRVHLNRGAAVRVTGDGRRVFLDRGEASFSVTHNAARPFAVIIGEVELRDVGTAFNVVRTSDGLVVTVRDGEVDLLRRRANAQRLGTGMRAKVDGSGHVAVSAANSSDAFSWESGRLVYHDAPLSDVIDDLNRYGPERISIGDTRAGGLRFSGVLPIDGSEVMLQRLKAFLPIQTEQDGDRIVVRSRQ